MEIPQNMAKTFQQMLLDNVVSGEDTWEFYRENSKLLQGIIEDILDIYLEPRKSPLAKVLQTWFNDNY